MSGCGAENPADTSDASTDAGTSGPQARLRVQGDASLTLRFGETRAFAVRYERDGRPVRDATIAFALEGRAHDSSLRTLEATTDAEGIARGEILAGRTLAAFQLRLLAEDAVASMDVSVGDQGFGSLRVTVDPYGGAWEVSTIDVTVFAGLECSDPTTFGGRGDRTRALLDGSGEVRFLGLPAGLEYAVVASGTNPDGELLARTCATAAVVADDERAIRIALRDLPLIIDGTYALVLETESSLGAVASGTVISAGTSMLESFGDSYGAGLFLDALDGVLATNGSGAGQAALADARAAGEGDVLEAALANEESGLAKTVLQLSERLAAWLAHVEIRTRFVATPAATPAFALEASDVFVGPETADTSLGLTLAGDVEASVSLDESTMAFEALRLPISPAQLAELALAALLRSDEAVGTGGWFRTVSGCPELTEWVLARPALDCDGACALSACRRAVTRIATAVGDALATLGDGSAILVLQGDAELVDRNLDRRTDEIRMELEGSWDVAEAITATGAAVRQDL